MKISSTAHQRWIALTLLSAIEFMILLDTSIVNIALPTVPGFQAAFLGAAFFAALGAVLTLLIVRGKRDKSAAHLDTQQDVSTGAHEMRVGHH